MERTLATLALIPGLLLVGCDDEPVEGLDEPMLPYAEAIAEETMEAAEPPPEVDGVPGVRIAIPARMKAAVSVTPVATDVECPGAMVTFAEGSAALSDGARGVLDDFAECVNETAEPEALTVRMELDPAPVEDFNETLATERATAVVAYLGSRDVDQSNFGVVAVGPEGSEEMPRLYPPTSGKR